MAAEPKPLPFVYQFMAGAVAGVSEVRALDVHVRRLLTADAIDSGDVRPMNGFRKGSGD